MGLKYRVLVGVPGMKRGDDAATQKWKTFISFYIIARTGSRKITYPKLGDDAKPALAVAQAIFKHRQASILATDAEGVDIHLLHGLQAIMDAHLKIPIKIELIQDDKTRLFELTLWEAEVQSVLYHPDGYIFNFVGKGPVDFEQF